MTLVTYHIFLWSEFSGMNLVHCWGHLCVSKNEDMGFGEHTAPPLSQDPCAWDQVKMSEGVSMVLLMSVVNENGTHVLSAKLSAQSEGKASSEPRLPAFRSLHALCPALLGNSHASSCKLPCFSKMRFAQLENRDANQSPHVTGSCEKPRGLGAEKHVISPIPATWPTPYKCGS